MRFLHLADVHLDTPFAGRTEALRNRLRSASREALRRAFDTALREDLDAVLVAGDLFDGTRFSFQTERFLMEQLRRLSEAGVEVVYATGNHDPGRDGTRARELPWPPRVTVVGGRTPRRVPIRGSGNEVLGWVTAAGHASRKEKEDLSRRFPRPPGERPEVGLLHTQVASARGAEDHDRYAPSTLEHLRRAGFDYWALGHVHRHQCLSREPPVWYPGNLQGRNPRETGARGGLLVDLGDRSAPRVDFRPFAPVRWERVEVGELEEAANLQGLVREIRNAWEADRTADPHGAADDWMVEVVLRGGTPLWAELGREEERVTLAEELAGVLDVLDVTVDATRVHPVVSVEEHRDREDVLGRALRLARDVRAGTSPVPPGSDDLAALELDGGLDVGSYVRDLLEGAEGEILARLLEGAD